MEHHRHHRHQGPDDDDEYPPPSQPYRHSSYDEPPPPTQVTRVHHSSPFNEEYGPGRDSYHPSPPPPVVDYGYAPPPPRPSGVDYGYAPPPPRPSGVDYGYAPPPEDYGYAPPPPRPSRADYGHAPPPENYGYAPPQEDYGYAPPPRRPSREDHDYAPPPPNIGGNSSVEHVSHHSHHPHLPSFIHHNTNQAPEISNKRSVRVYSKAEPNYSLTIRDGRVILARSNPSDPYQHWIKDERFSTKVKDEEGFPSFALVNKATGEALKHSIGATHPVQLIPYKPDYLDEAVLWTESRDLGDTYRTIRMVNNIRLNVDALNGDQQHGGVHDGTTIVLWEWKTGDNQRWKIIPY